MIGQLIQTEISGNLKALTGLTASCLLGFFLFVFASGLREIGFVISFAAISLPIAGLYIYTRARRERRARLLAQLPVTPLQVVVAEWSFTFLLILIPGSTLVVAGLLDANYSAADVLRSFLAFFFALISTLAALAIAQNLGNLGRPYSGVYQWLWIFLAGLLLMVVPISADLNSFFFSDFGEPNWKLITAFYAGSSVCLLGLNIWLHQLEEDYLGH